MPALDWQGEKGGPEWHWPAVLGIGLSEVSQSWNSHQSTLWKRLKMRATSAMRVTQFLAVPKSSS